MSSAVSAASAGIFFIITDYEVYLQYRFHFNMMIFDLIIKGGGDVFDFSRGTWLTGISVLTGVITAEIIAAILIWKSVKKNKAKRISVYTVTAVLLICIISNLGYAFADAARYVPITSIPRHIPFFHPLTAQGFFRKYGLVDTEKELTPVLDQKYRSSVHYPRKKMECSTEGTLPNFLFIATDSLRSDMLSEEIMPNLHAFTVSHPSLRFENHMSGGNGTRIGIFTLFYGMFGSFWEVMDNESKGPVLIQEMLKNKYQTGIFASASLAGPPFNRTVFKDIPKLRLRSEGKTAADRDRNITDEWIKWLDTADPSAPFFGFLFYDSPHTFFFPEDYVHIFKPVSGQVDYHKLNSDFDPEPLKNRMKTSVHFVDSLIGKVLKNLEERNLLENTVIVFTGDHGKELNENKLNYWGHGSNFTQYQLHVPLVIYWPGKEQALYSHLSSHMDIAPTLMREIFGCGNSYGDYSNGRSLFDTGPREWIYAGGFSQEAIIETDRITVSYPVGSYEIYDLSFRKLKDAELNIPVIQEVLNQRTAFYTPDR